MKSTSCSWIAWIHSLALGSPVLEPKLNILLLQLWKLLPEIRGLFNIFMSVQSLFTICTLLKLYSKGSGCIKVLNWGLGHHEDQSSAEMVLIWSSFYTKGLHFPSIVFKQCCRKVIHIQPIKTASQVHVAPRIVWSTLWALEATDDDCHILPLTGLNAFVYTGLNGQKL